MKNIIKDFYESENNGFRVLVAPTGLGKTYAWTEAVCDMLSEEQTGERSERSDNSGETVKKKRFFFITPLIKNLPVDKLRKKLIERGIMTEEEFDRDAILLKSAAENIIEVFPKVKERIEKNPIVRKSDEYHDLCSSLEFIYSVRKKNNHQSFFFEIARNNQEDFQKRIEPAFRRFLTDFFRKTYKTKKQRLSAIENDLKWSWIADLYPGTFIEEKRIIFLSLDKFLVRNATVVGTSSNIWKSDLVKDACILIDEIDSTKEKIFDRIIESSKEGRNLVDLFVSCHDALTGRSVDELLDGLLPSDASRSDAENQRKNAESIYQEYRLNHRFSLEGGEDTSNFIFTAGDTHVVSSTGASRRALIHFRGLKNVIEFIPSKDQTKGDADVKVMIDRIIGFKSSFQRWLFSLAVSYRDSYNDKVRSGQVENGEMIGTEDAITTVVNRVFKAESWQWYFTEAIMEMSFPSKAKRSRSSRKYDRSQELSLENNPLVGESDRFDYDFLTNGFTYVEFENARRHNEDTYIQMYQCTESPEKIIVDLASRARVIGLSATGDAMTVLKNYDMDYLKRHLGVSSVFFSKEEMEPVYRLASEVGEGYNGNITITPMKISADDALSNAEWLELVNGDSVKKDFIDANILGQANAFARKRYLKICKAFKQFWLNYDSIPLGYIMLNKIPKANDRDLNSKVLFDLFDIIIQTTGGDRGAFQSQDHVSIIAGEGFDEKKETFFKNFLEDGKHKLIITAYNSAGAGQNLQYQIASDDEENTKGIITIGGDRRIDKDGNIEVDANFIYLEKPSYVAQFKHGFSDTKTFFKALVQLTSLRESGSVSAPLFTRLLSDAFMYRAHMNEKAVSALLDEEQRQYSASAYDTIYRSQDFLGAVDLICEQAIGRMCRTRNKRNNIYILLDADLNVGQCLNPAHKGLSTPEYSCVCGITEKAEDHSETILLNKAQEHENHSRKFIERCLKTVYSNSETQYHWQMVRKLVMEKPTVSEQEYGEMSPWQQNFYIELPRETDRYWYKVSDIERFHDCRISFSEQPGYVCVSTEGSRLKDMMQVDLIRSNFEELGFATSFKQNRYILCPIVFNNIYKGALGEFAGQAIMERLGCPLQEVRSDAYEFFDYELKKKDEQELTLCLDFKNWHPGMEVSSNKKSLMHVASKAASYPLHNGKRLTHVVIANIIGEGPFKPYTTVMTKEDEPSLEDNVYVYVIPALIRGNHADKDGIKYIQKIIKNIRASANENNQDK